MLILVLNDGETFTNLEGCAIYSVPSGYSADEIEQALDAGHLEDVWTFGHQSPRYLLDLLIEARSALADTDDEMTPLKRRIDAVLPFKED